MARTYKAGVLITGDSKGAVKAINLTEKDLEKLGKTTASVGARTSAAAKKITDGFSHMAVNAAKWGAAVGTAAAVATTALVKSGLASADALAKTADKLGVTTEALAAFRFAAEQTGVSNEKADVALQRFTRRLADAASGTGPAVKAFEALGLSASELIELSPDKAFAKVAEQMNKVENQSQKVSLAFKLFDSEGVDLVRTLALGEEGLARMAEEAEVLGLTLSRIDAAKVEQANDAWNRISKAITGFSQHLAAKFAPLLTLIADRLFGITKEAGGMGNVATKAFNAITKAVGVVGNAIAGLSAAWHGMVGVVYAVGLKVVDALDAMAETAHHFKGILPWNEKTEYKSDFDEWRNYLTQGMDESWAKMQEIVSSPLPSEAVEVFVNDAQRQYGDLASAAVASQGAIQGEIIETADVTGALATTTKKAAKDVQDAWSKALEGTVNRIDEAFASAWKGSMDSFSSFADSLKDAFKNLLAELAHLAITRPIVMSIGAAFGLGSGSAAASSGGVSGGISGVLSGLSGGIGSAYSGASQFLLNSSYKLGTDTFLGGLLNDAGLSAGGMANASLGTLGLTAGAGLLGGFLGNKVFGGGSGIGATIGGIGGSIFGPLGAGVGSFLGAGIDSLFGSDKTPNRGARATLDLSTGQLTTLGRQPGDPKFSQANFDSVQGAAAIFAQFAELIGGSGASFNIAQGDRRGVRLNGEKFANMSDAIAVGLEDIIAAATDLDPVLKKLISNFDGTTEQMLQFSAAMVSISEMSKTNPVDQAIQDFAEAQESAGRTLLDNYNQQITSLKTLITNFDGSAVAAMELNTALASNKQFTYEMALAIKGLSEQISTMLGNSAQQIRESVMTDSERVASWRQQRNELRESLGHLVDPQEIQETAAQINTLTNQIFGALSDEQQRVRADSFAEYLERVDEVSQRQLEKSLNSIAKSQRELNSEIAALLRTQSEAMSAAVGDFGSYVNYLTTRGITVNVQVAETGEVNG